MKSPADPLLKGRSLKEVQAILGHREFTMTLRYAHLRPDRLRDAVATLEGFSTKSAHGAKIDRAEAPRELEVRGNVGRPRSSGG